MQPLLTPKQFIWCPRSRVGAPPRRSPSDPVPRDQGAPVIRGLAPASLVINDRPEDQQSPALTTNDQHRYLVLWQYAYPGPCCDWDIRGQELDVAGNLQGGELIIADSTDDEQDPAVAARPGAIRDYLATWRRTTSSGETIEATRWGDVTPSFFEVANVAFWDSESPAVAWDRASALIVYAADSQGDPTVYRHIYGRRWAPNATFLPLVTRNQ